MKGNPMSRPVYEGGAGDLLHVLLSHRIERCTVSSPEQSEQWGICLYCGFESDPVPLKGVNWEELQRDIYAAHISEAIRAEGLSVIKLPERVAAPDYWAPDHVACYPVSSGSDPVSAWQNGGVADSEGNFMSAEVARARGLALFAASLDAFEVRSVSA